MKYYKIGNAPYCFPCSKEEYFQPINEVEQDTHSYIEITEKEYKKLVKEQEELFKGE